MFRQSTVHVRQKAQAGSKNEDNWVEVVLMTAKVGDVPYRDVDFSTSNQRGDDDLPTMSKLIESHVQGYGWWGRWKPGSNSVNFQVDNEFSVGSAHRDSRYWVYNFKDAELHLVQRTMESGWSEQPGGPPTGYKVTYSTALKLYGAKLDGRGVKPMQGDEGTGWVYIGSRLLRQERIYWQKATNF